MSQVRPEEFESDAAALEKRLTPNDQLSTGLTFGVAQSLQEVIEAWKLVYSNYRRIGLINPNPFRLHLTPQAIGDDTVVITGQIRAETVSTLTCIRDTPAGLPLDHEYRHELDTLRHAGRRLTEIGLLADRRKQLNRTADSLFMLMHYSLDYTFRDGGTDAVIGVHPRHARFYSRAFGFEPCGPERTYAAVNNHPVVLLRLEREAIDRPGRVPRGLRYLKKHPVADSHYADRYRFDLDQITGSQIDQYLRA